MRTFSRPPVVRHICCDLRSVRMAKSFVFMRFFAYKIALVLFISTSIKLALFKIDHAEMDYSSDIVISYFVS